MQFTRVVSIYVKFKKNKLFLLNIYINNELNYGYIK